MDKKEVYETLLEDIMNKKEYVEYLVEEMLYQKTLFEVGEVRLHKNNKATFVIEFDLDDYDDFEERTTS